MQKTILSDNFNFVTLVNGNSVQVYTKCNGMGKKMKEQTGIWTQAPLISTQVLYQLDYLAPVFKSTRPFLLKLCRVLSCSGNMIYRWTCIVLSGSNTIQGGRNVVVRVKLTMDIVQYSSVVERLTKVTGVSVR